MPTRALSPTRYVVKENESLMKNVYDISELIFLGIAERIKHDSPAYPIGKVDLFRLTKHSGHFWFPIAIKDYQWVFIAHKNLLTKAFESPIIFKILSKANKEIGNVTFKVEIDENRIRDSHLNEGEVIIHDDEWVVLNFNIETVIEEPGEYRIKLDIDSDSHSLGRVHFHYIEIPPFTVEEIKALESNPYSVKGVSIELGCKHCSSKFKVYSALSRNKEWEGEGYLWHCQVDDNYTCNCGKTKFDMKYIKANLQAGLIFDIHSLSGGISYERRYAHSQILKTIEQFNQLLEDEQNEAPFQKFIETHPLLLARFSAKKIFFKPNILGKFETDFAILDTSNRLLLIELEKPSLPLFLKNSGHPTSKLIHAYEQVRDWLHEYSKHPHAVLETLDLTLNKINSVRGIVIAGRSKDVNPKHLQRDLSKPMYNDIDFFTLDDLAQSLAQISRTLA